ncbi:Flap endonuclease GEN 1 [Hypsizygus marmoreus]|uniref:Flap endonuclease GEN 1 n=1 Tax=Hypsizygus marmoreus TaxID=39966 RepID=A0A369JJ13_HYPMA|nr:Flap endonuclease GEN 1 [Hypsizygus marmoreus]
MEQSLLHLATNEGYLRNRAKRCLMLGVDMSIWIDNCQAAFQGATLHTHAGENPELRAFFFKLCRYLKLPVVLVFVLDGPEHPSIKRGQAAPGEAEAELAKLNSLGLIDAILTDDSDALVFGGELSYDFDRVILYNADAIKYSDGVKLSRGGLLLFALLVGGDYDDGIEGCGATTARALAQCGFGDDLLEAAMSRSPPKLQEFLSGWREKLRSELRFNSCGLLRCRNPGIAEKITDEFPDLTIMNNYLAPLTSWSPSQPGHQVPSAAGWRAREPSIQRITAFCLQRFGWDRDAEIVKRFRTNLWEGVAFRMLCSPLVRYDGTRHFLTTPTTNTHVLSQADSKKVASRLTPSHRLTISTKNFQDLMGEPWANLLLDTDTISLHVPTCILQTTAPSILQSQIKPKRQSKGKHQAAMTSGMHVKNTPVAQVSTTTQVIEIIDDLDFPVASGNGPVSSEIIELTDSDEGSVIDLT